MGSDLPKALGVQPPLSAQDAEYEEKGNYSPTLRFNISPCWVLDLFQMSYPTFLAYFPILEWECLFYTFTHCILEADNLL